jgi:hypothetical protein
MKNQTGVLIFAVVFLIAINKNEISSNHHSIFCIYWLFIRVLYFPVPFRKIVRPGVQTESAAPGKATASAIEKAEKNHRFKRRRIC